MAYPSHLVLGESSGNIQKISQWNQKFRIFKDGNLLKELGENFIHPLNFRSIGNKKVAK